MIIPTAEFDPMFANDGVPFRDKMIKYIVREFSDKLGPSEFLHDDGRGRDLLSNTSSPSATAPLRETRAA